MDKVFNVIVEGPTRVGKGTLIRKLMELPRFHGAFTHHFGFPPDEGTPHDKMFYQRGSFDTAMQWMVGLNGSGIKVLLDRCWVGERIFGPMYRGYHPDPRLRRMEEELIPRMAPTFMVRLRCSYSDVVARHAESGDARPLISEDAWDRLNADYEEAYSAGYMCRDSILDLNSGIMTPPQLASSVTRFLSLILDK